MNRITALLIAGSIASGALASTYPVVDTGQSVACGEFAGQDAHYSANSPSYRDNDAGTVSDLVTGLTWTRDSGEKMTHAQAIEGTSDCRVGGYDDWRLATIKELYSLINFSGEDPDPRSTSTGDLPPFIDNTVFEFRYGVNFADGRIKGYLVSSPRGKSTLNWKLFKDWETDSYNLYNLESDPGEKNDLASKEPDIFENMLATMNQRLQNVEAQLLAENPDYDPAAEPQRRRRQR